MRLYLRTFGCRANQADTESVRRLALAAGVEIVDDVERADVAVYNSCTVTAEAESDLRASVRRAARRNERLRTVVMGCAAARDDGRLASLPSVVAIVSGGAMVDVARALDLPPNEPLAYVAQAGTRALLRIQDGCAEHCTFCATTLARGAHRSRHSDSTRAAELIRARIVASLVKKVSLPLLESSENEDLTTPLLGETSTSPVKKSLAWFFPFEGTKKMVTSGGAAC